MTDAEILQAMRLLELAPADLLGIRQAASAASAQEATETLQAKVRKAFRKLAPALHPDRAGNDPAKVEAFKLVSAFVDEVSRMAPPRVRPRARALATLRFTVQMHVPARVL